MHQSPRVCFCLEDLQICISCPLEILQLIMLPALLFVHFVLFLEILDLLLFHTILGLFVLVQLKKMQWVI